MRGETIQRLKPQKSCTRYGTAEAVPYKDLIRDLRRQHQLELRKG